MENYIGVTHRIYRGVMMAKASSPNGRSAQHDPSPEERDERVRLEGWTPEQALKALVCALNDDDSDDAHQRPPDGNP